MELRWDSTQHPDDESQLVRLPKPIYLGWLAPAGAVVCNAPIPNQAMWFMLDAGRWYIAPWTPWRPAHFTIRVTQRELIRVFDRAAMASGLI